MKNQNKMYKTTYKSPVGLITLISDGYNLCGLFIKGQKYFMDGFDDLIDNNKLDVFSKTKKLLDKYFKGEVIDNKNLPIKITGTSFRCNILSIIKNIPYGKVMTYKEVGEKLKNITGKNVSYQAVGTAISHNPISIIIPCHRVIKSNGRIGGYAGGENIKKKLLKLEGINNEF